MKLTQTTVINLRGAETKRKNLTFFKETIQLSLKSGKGHLKQNKLKKKWKGREILHKWWNKPETKEVQINEEEIGKLPEKEFRITIVKMIKNLENKMEKCKT